MCASHLRVSTLQYLYFSEQKRGKPTSNRKWNWGRGSAPSQAGNPPGSRGFITETSASIKEQEQMRRTGLSCCRWIWLQPAPSCQMWHSQNLASFLDLLLSVWQEVALPRLVSRGGVGGGANFNESQSVASLLSFYSMASAFRLQQKQLLNLF